MAKSMTGFGAGTATGNGWRSEVTLRTLNHRYLAVRMRSLSDRPHLQVKLDEAVKKAFHRGEINVTIDLARERNSCSQELFDRAVVEDKLNALRRLAQELDLPSPPSLADLIQVGAFQEGAQSEEDPWPVIKSALAHAITATIAAREAEGVRLAQEIEQILAEISSLLVRVKARIPQVTEELHTRLCERIAALQVEVDPSRLEMEIALLVERHDIREEITRLEAHLARAAALLDRDGSLGKEFDFLCQEFLREVNTLGSKSRDLEINSLVIDMKLAISNCKEQVQNVE
ncbi:YicC family protein [Candidatus Bipolaricaulota bacterium]|nr:YicC family protein [Candidatus Bipolaricaulota bacterium]